MAEPYHVETAQVSCLEHNAKNLNHPTLPEIQDFNALGDARCLNYFA